MNVSLPLTHFQVQTMVMDCAFYLDTVGDKLYVNLVCANAKNAPPSTTAATCFSLRFSCPTLSASAEAAKPNSQAQCTK